jgi:osmoprotectant transport system substrate-binding protein
MRRFRMIALGASTMALLVSACSTGGGGSSSPSAAASGSTAASPAGKPTIKVGSANFPESQIVGEIYAQALEAKGFKVERKLNLGVRALTNDALRAGAINLMPEYIGTEATQLGAVATGDPAQTLTNLNAALAKLDTPMIALNYSPGADVNGFVVRKETADQFHLATLSDAAKVASQLRWGLPPECATTPGCAPALKSAYGIDITMVKEWKKLAPCSEPMAVALNTSVIDVAELCTTQADIVRFNFVLLQDDKHSQTADNMAPILRKDTADQGGATLTDTLNAVSAKLTTDVLTKLGAQVSIDQKKIADVAKQFLTDNGLV